jgi:tetrahydromethanopterin S-methyltransferase subunit B
MTEKTEPITKAATTRAVDALKTDMDEVVESVDRANTQVKALAKRLAPPAPRT